MKKHILIALIATIGVSSTLFGDDGWYMTRKIPQHANHDLEVRGSNIRDLVTNCTERGISLACHRAGVWFIKSGDKKRGVKYLSDACTLGRGYSCRLVGEYYSNEVLGEKDSVVSTEKLEKTKATSKKAKKYFIQGCFRNDKKSCGLMGQELPLPKVKKSGFEKLNEILNTNEES